MRTWIGLLIVGALMATGCGRLQQRRSGPVEYPRGRDDLVLRVEETGIFGPEAWILRSLPSFSLYGDGRMIAAGSRDETYPPPLLQPLTVQQVSQEGVQTILAAADEVGLLGPDRELSGSEELGTDAGYVVFTVNAAGGRHVVSVYAFDEDPGYAPSDQRDAREALIDFVDSLATLEEWLPAGSVGPKERYVPDRLRIVAGPHSTEFLLMPPLGEEPPPQELPEIQWPLEMPIPEFGVSQPSFDATSPLRCGAVRGRELRNFLAAAATASEYTPWVSDRERFGLIIRPLFPGDPDC